MPEQACQQHRLASSVMFKLASSIMFKPDNRQKQAVRFYVCSTENGNDYEFFALGYENK